MSRNPKPCVRDGGLAVVRSRDSASSLQAMIRTGPPQGRAGFIGYILVPDRFAAVFDRANRLSCRVVDVDAKDPFQASRLRLVAAHHQRVAAHHELLL